MGLNHAGVSSQGYTIGVGAALLISFALLFGVGELLLLVITAAAVHELGHFAALRITGGRILGLRLGVTGLTIIRGQSATYIDEIIVAAAGPLAGGTLAAAAALIARIAHFQSAYRLAGMSLVFTIFNLLPVPPLDGGRVLHAAISMRVTNPATADRAICIVGCAVIFLLLCAGAYILIATRTNFSLLAAGICLLWQYCKNHGHGVEY